MSKGRNLIRYTRVYLSVSHLKTAAHFTRESGEIEAKGKPSHGLFNVHESNVLGAILSSVAFLEAAINETYSDAEDMSAPDEILRFTGIGYARELSKKTRGILAGLWGTDKFRMGARTLEKYQIALRIAEAEEFNTGHNPYQAVSHLIQLRNALIHYKPESHYEGQSQIQEIEDRLKRKFPLNPFMENHKNTPFFPSKCLSYGCALWALKSSLAFTNEFFSRLKLQPFYASSDADMTRFYIEYASMKPLDKLAVSYNLKPTDIVDQ